MLYFGLRKFFSESFSLPVFKSSSSFRHAGEKTSDAPTVPHEFRRRAIASRAKLPAADGTRLGTAPLYGRNLKRSGIFVRMRFYCIRLFHAPAATQACGQAIPGDFLSSARESIPPFESVSSQRRTRTVAPQIHP